MVGLQVNVARSLLISKKSYTQESVLYNFLKLSLLVITNRLKYDYLDRFVITDLLILGNSCSARFSVFALPNAVVCFLSVICL